MKAVFTDSLVIIGILLVVIIALIVALTYSAPASAQADRAMIASQATTIAVRSQPQPAVTKPTAVPLCSSTYSAYYLQRCP